MGTGTDVAIGTSGHAAPWARSRATWSGRAPTALRLPLAAMWLLNPIIAGAAGTFSSVFVVTNSLRLRSFRSRAEG